MVIGAALLLSLSCLRDLHLLCLTRWPLPVKRVHGNACKSAKRTRYALVWDL